MDHQWIGAFELPLTDRETTNIAATPSWASKVRLTGGRCLVDVMEVYCTACRRPYDDVVDEPCVAGRDAPHLIGGPTGKRKPRKVHAHDCRLFGCSGMGIPESTAAAVREMSAKPPRA